MSRGSVTSDASKSDEKHNALLREIEHYIEHKKLFDNFYIDLLKKVGKLDETYIIGKFNLSTIKLNSLEAAHQTNEMDRKDKIYNLQII